MPDVVEIDAASNNGADPSTLSNKYVELDSNQHNDNNKYMFLRLIINKRSHARCC